MFLLGDSWNVTLRPRRLYLCSFTHTVNSDTLGENSHWPVFECTQDCVIGGGSEEDGTAFLITSSWVEAKPRWESWPTASSLKRLWKPRAAVLGLRLEKTQQLYVVQRGGEAVWKIKLFVCVCVCVWTFHSNCKDKWGKINVYASMYNMYIIYYDFI